MDSTRTFLDGIRSAYGGSEHRLLDELTPSQLMKMSTRLIAQFKLNMTVHELVGMLRQMPELAEPRGALIQKLRDSYATDTGDPDTLAFCRWFLADRAMRPVFPGAKQNVSNLFEIFLNVGQLDKSELLTCGDQTRITQALAARKKVADKQAAEPKPSN